MADTETSRRDYRGPYNRRKKIPTIQGYRQFKQEQRENLGGSNVSAGESTSSESSEDEANAYDEGQGGVQQRDMEDTSEVQNTRDLKERRHKLKKRGTNRAERQVTDPVTHLPVTIRDYNDEDFEDLDDEQEQEKENDNEFQPVRRSSGSRLSQHDNQQRAQHEGMEDLFPPPSYSEARLDLEKEYRKGVQFAIICVVVICALTMIISSTFLGYVGGLVFLSTFGAGGCWAMTFMVQGWAEKKFRAIWEDEVWQAERMVAHKKLHSEHPESTRWFNKLIGSIWPLINPEIFASLGDTLEDVMQASLPGMVRMVSIDDLGQGSDAMRILGVRWLPAGAAGKTVSSNGKLEGSAQHTDQKKGEEKSGKSQESQEAKDDASMDTNNRPSQNQDEQGDKGQQGSNVAGGMEAEEGDFINLEIAFAYRSTHSRRKFRDRAKHAHIYMAFYLPGNIKLPVWVELQGLVGSLRLRMQLTPDPPFVGLATMTFLGQPKVELSCTPLFRLMPNLMDLPLISNFVQSAVDAAMAEYVAPKSKTLDLKAMTVGNDYKLDTSARGIIYVKLKRAFDFKASDVAIPVIRKGSSDPYVSVGWAKFGKPLFSTRVLVDEMHPWWQEEVALLVGPEELDAEEFLRVQLWDSDRTTADDDLGRIEIPVKELMKNEKSNGKMWERTDTFQAMKAGETMPGRLEWSVGYFTKTRVMDYNVAHASGDSSIKTVEQLKNKSYENSKAKLREAAHTETPELELLKKQDFEEKSVEVIAQSPPTEEYPSGILSIVVHQITNLEFEQTNQSRDQDAGEAEDTEAEQGDDLPDSYCTIILNHKEIFKTRTKPKNAHPFFNAGTEKYVRDWRTTEIMVAVRDARVHEDDALLGIVYLPLGKMLKERGSSQFNEYWPLTGGIGYGRVRISIVFRSVQLKLPAASLGWDFGTVEIAPTISAVGGQIRHDLISDRLKLRTNMASGRMHHVSSSSSSSASNSEATWQTRHSRPIRLPVRNRYRQPLIIEFRAHGALHDKTPAFSVLWLQNLPDNDAQDVELVVWKGDLKRASVNCLPGTEMGEKVGMIRLKLTFWRGIGKWHARYARHSDQMKNVVEVLWCAKDQGLVDCLVGDQEWLRRRHEGRLPVGQEVEVSESEDEGSSDSETGGGKSERVHQRAARRQGDADADPAADSDSEAAAHERKIKRRDTENEGGVMNELKSYMNHRHQLHRRQRGLMQFKAPRTIKWFEGKVESMAHKVESKFTHREREPGIETEV